MGSSQKKIICSSPEHENICDPELYDWFSNLPNDILRHILSDVDMTEVMKTSQLARTWRYIWDSVPCLNFDLREFGKKKRSSYRSYGECVLRFWLFVKWSILTREAPTIDKVRFFCDYFDGYQLEMLISLCAVRNFRELYVSAGYGVQQCPLYCALPENVEAIAENIRDLLDLEPPTGLWNFKTLHLVGVRFLDADIIERLLGDSGVLENLSIESCCFLMIKFLKMSTNKLRKLNFVNRGLSLWGRNCSFGGELELHTPNLESFSYCGPAIRFSESSDMPFLKNASVLLRLEDHPRVPSKHLCSMVSAIHHVENLSLSAFFLLYFNAAIRRSRRKFTPFGYLKCLKLDLECNPDCIEGLINVLQHSPNLETLCIELNQDKYGDALSSNGSKRERKTWLISSWKSREEDVPCLSRNMKEIEIVGFCDSLNWFELIKFFLQNGKSLERMRIFHKETTVNLEKFYALQEVQLASEAVSMSIFSTSASGQKDLIQLVYGNCGRSVQTNACKTKITLRSSARYNSDGNPPIQVYVRRRIRKQAGGEWRVANE